MAVYHLLNHLFDPFFEFFGIPQGSFEQPQQPQQQRGGGSGVIISPDGNIVTANGTAPLEFAKEAMLALNIAPENAVTACYDFYKLGCYAAPMPNF